MLLSFGVFLSKENRAALLALYHGKKTGIDILIVMQRKLGMDEYFDPYYEDFQLGHQILSPMIDLDLVHTETPELICTQACLFEMTAKGRQLVEELWERDQLLLETIPERIRFETDTDRVSGKVCSTYREIETLARKASERTATEDEEKMLANTVDVLNIFAKWKTEGDLA